MCSNTLLSMYTYCNDWLLTSGYTIRIQKKILQVIPGVFFYFVLHRVAIRLAQLLKKY